MLFFVDSFGSVATSDDHWIISSIPQDSKEASET